MENTAFTNRQIFLGTLAGLLFLGASGFLLTVSSQQLLSVSSKRKGFTPVVCQESVWDLGTIDNVSHSFAKHVFSLQNLSASSVRCQVHPSCGCIITDKEVEIAGHASVALPIEIDLAGPPGPILKEIRVSVMTDPPAEIMLQIKGGIAANPAGRSVPSTVDFGVARGPVTRTVRVCRYDGSPVKYLGAHPSHPSIQVIDTKRVDKTGSVVEITLSLKPQGLANGSFRSKIVVLTSSESHPMIEVPLVANIAGMSTGLVDSLFVSRLEPNQPVECSLIQADASEPEILEVVYTGEEGIAVEFLKTGGKRCAVKISRKDDSRAAPRLLQGELAVTIQSQAAPVKIPLRVLLVSPTVAEASGP